MVKNFFSQPPPAGTGTFGIDRVKLRLTVIVVLVVSMFVALFSRLWFLQVLASEDYSRLAKENRVRVVHSEPERGRILDRNHKVLVRNRLSLAITVDRQIIDEPSERRRTVHRLAWLLAGDEHSRRFLRKTKQGRKLLRETKKDLRRGLRDITVSPYKPVAVAYDVNRVAVNRIRENPEDFPGIGIERLPVREYPQGGIAAHILGWVGEINGDELKSDFFRRLRYGEGDIVGKTGVERVYDRHLRGRPRITRVVVNSENEVIGEAPRQDARPGKDLVLTLDVRIQRLTENALEDGIMAARGAGYPAPNGGAVVMDPMTGEILGMASFPTYPPATLADGLSFKEEDRLANFTPHLTEDDALYNRAIQAAVPPGSTFKVVTAGAAIANGVTTPYESIDCDPSYIYPSDNTEFNNWTSADLGTMSLSRALELSCDTYFYQLGARMEDRWGAGSGNGEERFQRYMRLAGFGHPTGVDLPYETAGRVPDDEWCDFVHRETGGALCPEGWYPGYTINMAIGQGDLIVSPIQMAVTFAALVNGGDVLEPRIADSLGRPNPEVEGEETVTKQFQTKTADKLPLDETTLAIMRQGLEAVVSGADGTANSAFAGFPLDAYPVAGKTGTAQIGSLDSGKNFAWFISYAPADDPQYVIAVYIDRAGHGGESAAPVARQIYEGIFEHDKETDVHLGTDASG